MIQSRGQLILKGDVYNDPRNSHPGEQFKCGTHLGLGHQVALHIFINMCMQMFRDGICYQFYCRYSTGNGFLEKYTKESSRRFRRLIEALQQSSLPEASLSYIQRNGPVGELRLLLQAGY